MQPETTDMLLQLTSPYMEYPCRGNYTVLAFDGEYNGLLSERAAITPQNITVTDGSLEPVVGNLL